MAYDYSKLIGRITEMYGSRASFAKAMDISGRSLSLKLNGKRNFRQDEIVKACDLLKLDSSEVSEYFFNLNVQ